jgi:tetratricopeptide (TPR) repeat protein
MTRNSSRTLLVGLVVLLGAALAAGAGWVRARGRIDPEAVRVKAQEDAGAGRWEDVARALRQLDAHGPPPPDELLLRARLDLVRDRPEEAIALLDRIPDASPVAARARLLAGQVQLRRGHMRHAERYLLEAIRLEPKLLMARRELVFIYGMQTRRQALGEQMQALAEGAPLTFEHLFLWCLTRGSVWDAAELTKALQSYVDADPEDRWSRLALADALQNLGRLDEAERLLAPLPDSDPDARAGRIRLALERGENAKAAALLADAPPDHAALARARGRLALLRRDPQAALEAYRVADRAEPNHRDTVFGLSQALRMTGHPEEAAAYAKLARGHDEVSTLLQYAATAKAKTDPELPMKLGAACEAVGRIAEARGWYQLAVDRNPLDANAQRALYRVKAGAQAGAPATAARG